MKKSPIIVPTDVPSVYDQLTTLARKAIVRPNNPPPGIGGFLFDIDLDGAVELTSEITDNVLEDNTVVNDGIGLSPERVTVRGIVAELTDAGTLPSEAVNNPQPLPLFPPLFPKFGIGAALDFSPAFRSVGSVVSGVTDSLRKATGINLVPSLDLAATVTGNLGPFSATTIVSTVTNQLGGVVNVSSAVRGAIGNAVNGAVKSLGIKNAPLAGTINAVINSAVGNVLGNAFTPAVKDLVGQSVNSSVATLSAAASPGADQSPTAWRYYIDRSTLPEGGTRQADVFAYFYQCWKGRLLFSVETPWGIFENMALLSVRAEQSEETKDATTFTVVFKKMRIAGQATVNLGQLAGRNAFQAAASAPAQNGVAGLTPATPAQAESWLRSVTGNLGGGG